MHVECVEAITNESERNFPEMAPGEPGSKDAYVFYFCLQLRILSRQCFMKALTSLET